MRVQRVSTGHAVDDQTRSQRRRAGGVPRRSGKLGGCGEGQKAETSRWLQEAMRRSRLAGRKESGIHPASP